MRHATLPAQLKGWYKTRITDPFPSENTRIYWCVAAKVKSEEEVDLPTFFYDEKGHNTKVVNSQIISILPDPVKSKGLPGNPSYVNSSGPTLVAGIMYKNGISANGAIRVVCDEDNVHIYQSEIRHGIGSTSYRSWFKHTFAKFGSFIQGRYTVQFFEGTNQGEWSTPCDRNFDARTKDPVPLLAEAAALPVEGFRTVNSWSFDLTLGYTLPTGPRSWFDCYEPDWLVYHTRSTPPWVTEGQAQAFKQAVDQFPKYADNNIANLKDMAELVISVLKGEGLEMLAKAMRGSKFQRLLNAWMIWRYAYSTTKADVKQAIDACARQRITYLKPLRFDGDAYMPLIRYDGLAHYHVSFEVVQQTSDMIRALRHGLYMAGIEVNAYTIYDLIPFSFVVDWFTGIGDTLESKAIGDHYSDYIFSSVEWSITYTIDDGSTKCKCYSRWYDNTIPPVPQLDLSRGPSANTWFKRGIDTVALVYHD
jgi:hypothetical protein